MIAFDESLRQLCNSLDALVDEHVGIIRYVHELPRESGAPDFFHFSAYAANTRAFCSQQNFANGGGASSRRVLAMAKAIGEAVERYCSAIFESDELPLSGFDEARFQCVPPHKWATYGSEQYHLPDFPYVPFDRETRIRWVESFDIGTGESWYVPASMVFIPYLHEDAGDNPIVQPISTGLACHMTKTAACISAICEIVERDAFTITWQARIAMPQILIESLSDRNQDLVARFERGNCKVSLFSLQMEHKIPCVLGILRGVEHDTPALVFAAAADPDPEEAVRKSLEEVAHTRRLAHRLHLSLPSLASEFPFSNIKNHDDHVRFYCNHANASLANFMFASQECIDFRDLHNLATGKPQENLENLTEQIRRTGHQVLIVDLTTSDVGDLGFTVVRALIPGFHPLFIGHQRRALGGSRLWEIPQRLGYKGIARGAGDNPAPHPFP